MSSSTAGRWEVNRRTTTSFGNAQGLTVVEQLLNGLHDTLSASFERGKPAGMVEQVAEPLPVDIVLERLEKIADDLPGVAHLGLKRRRHGYEDRLKGPVTGVSKGVASKAKPGMRAHLNSKGIVLFWILRLCCKED